MALDLLVDNSAMFTSGVQGSVSQPAEYSGWHDSGGNWNPVLSEVAVPGVGEVGHVSLA